MKQRKPAARLGLALREVHIWCVPLHADARDIDGCTRLLSTDELARLSRLPSERARADFAVSKGVLRMLVGHYLGKGPDTVRFSYEQNGKPVLDEPGRPLEFNVSHSGQLSVYAVAHRRQLGIDVEQVRLVGEQEQIVRRYFAKEECDDWLELQDPQRGEGFFNCWTRKEAYVKALGEGLYRPLDSFRVSLRPRDPAVLIHADGDYSASNTWSLYSFVPATGYIGALAIRDDRPIIRLIPALSASQALRLAHDGELG